MKELIDLISSITVLIAALAGISAVNKWKKERFFKVKIDAIEKYEDSLKNFASNVEKILDKSDMDFYLSESNSVDSYPEQIANFFDNKSESVEFLKVDLDEVERLFGIYSGYAGNKLAFSQNYYNSTYVLMRYAVVVFNVEVSRNKIFYEEFDEDVRSYFMVEFLDAKNEFFDIVDYMMISSPEFLYTMGGYDDSVFMDRRLLYKDIFLNIVSAEKMALHSSFFESAFIRIKILIMKYRVIGRVICISDKHAISVSVNGFVFRQSTNGESYEVLEEKNRSKLFRKLIKAEVMRHFS